MLVPAPPDEAPEFIQRVPAAPIGESGHKTSAVARMQDFRPGAAPSRSSYPRRIPGRCPHAFDPPHPSCLRRPCSRRHRPCRDEVPTGRLPRTVMPSLVQLELKLDPDQANSADDAHPGQGSEPTTWCGCTQRPQDRQGRSVRRWRQAHCADSDRSPRLRACSAQRRRNHSRWRRHHRNRIRSAVRRLQGAYRVKPTATSMSSREGPLGARTVSGFDEPSSSSRGHHADRAGRRCRRRQQRGTKTEKLPGGFNKVTYARTGRCRVI